jgi:hypothetical protein
MFRCNDDRGHDRGEPGDSAAAEVISVREATGKYYRFDLFEIIAGVKERDRGSAG